MSTGRLIGTLAVALTLAGGVTARAQDPRTLPDTIGDLNAVQLVEIVDPAGQVLLHGTMATSSNTPKETERKAELMSPNGQKAKGKIGFEIERKDKSIKNEVEVELERMPISTQCELRLDGKVAATFLTSKQGRAKFELERKN